MEGAVLSFLVETFGSKLLSKTYERSTINPLSELLEKKTSEILTGIKEISEQLSETQKSIDALQDTIKWEFVSAPIKELRDKIDIKFQRYVKYVSDRDGWESDTIRAFADEILIGDGSIENLIALFNHKVYESEERYYERNTQRILDSHQTFSNKSREPAQCVLYKFYSMLLMIELKAFLMQFSAYSIRIELGQGNYSKEKEILMKDFGTKFRRIVREMSERVEAADRTLWRGDPPEHVESDPIHPEKGTYCFGYTLKHLGRFRRFLFYISNRYIIQHYFLGNRTLNLRFCNYHYFSSTLLNYVITGVRFIRTDKYFGNIYLEIEESKLLPHGKIDPNTRRIAPRCRDEDTSTFYLSQNFSSIVLGCDLELSKDYDNYILTGIQFAVQESQLKLMATFTEFDIESGKLGKRTKEAVSPNASNMIDISSRSCPTDFNRTQFHDDGEVFGVKFDACYQKSPKDIRIAPFIDTQRVNSAFMGLAGIGLHWRCTEDCAGFIAPKLITYPVGMRCGKP